MKIKQISYHRNGVSGNGFHAVLFHDKEIKNGIAVVFDEPGNVAVFDLDLLQQGDINFGSNSWRGDYFESDLRAAIQLKAAGKE